MKSAIRIFQKSPKSAIVPATGYRLLTTNYRSAFSLIELLIVVGIIIILASIGVGVGYQVNQAAKAEQTKTRITIIMNAVKDYFDQTGGYPLQADDDDFRMVVPRLDQNGERTDYKRFVNKLKELDADDAIQVEFIETDYARFDIADAYGNEIRYDVDGAIGGTPLLVSPGPDGNYRMDGEDDDEKAAWGADDLRSDK